MNFSLENGKDYGPAVIGIGEVERILFDEFVFIEMKKSSEGDVYSFKGKLSLKNRQHSIFILSNQKYGNFEFESKNYNVSFGFNRIKFSHTKLDCTVQVVNPE